MSPNLKRGFYQSSEIIIMDYLSNEHPTGGFLAVAMRARFKRFD